MEDDDDIEWKEDPFDRPIEPKYQICELYKDDV
jgi:hypothetical protein